ncbi:MAG: hypothetical protein HQ472_10125 [Ignavibacteria bacterium]|nr:hypothetical protein [Ignavibacteria bacterium]
MLMFVLLASLTFAFVFQGCGQSTVTNPESIVFPDSAVSYNAHVYPFLSLACGQCHGESTRAGGIRLTSYSALFFDRPNLVVPEKPDESLLAQVLEGVITHSTGGIDRVTPNQKLGIRTWIKEGAFSN